MLLLKHFALFVYLVINFQDATGFVLNSRPYAGTRVRYEYFNKLQHGRRTVAQLSPDDNEELQPKRTIITNKDDDEIELNAEPFGALKRWWNKDGIDDIKTYGTSIIVALLFRTFVVEPRYIPSLSMFPTLQIGDQLAVEKVTHFYRPYDRNDVVVFRPPEAFDRFSSQKREALIKRIVAVDGDTVEVKKGNLYINGEIREETFINEQPEYDWGPMVVPKGNVMVLGDNRNHSLDSHIWGFLPKKNVIGRAVLKYWPLWRFGLVES